MKQLTKEIRYTTDNGVSTLYALNLNTLKWEAVFYTDEMFIHRIKIDGMLSAIRNGLLIPVNPTK